MSSDVEMAGIELTARQSPSPSESPTQGKRKCSQPLEDAIGEDSQGTKENQAHDENNDSVDPANESSPSLNVPGGASPIHNANPSSKVQTSILNAGCAAHGKAGEEDEITETERYCRKKEKEYPDIALKAEDCNAWQELSDTLTKHDGDQLDAHHQSIDVLLILSGFFSVVVTMLIIEAYKRLRQDPADTTAQLLLQISMQLRSLSVNPGFINSTYIPAPLSFSPQPSAVAISILWSMSLVLSLVTASLGMLVKQWLREYSLKSNVSPELCCQVRMFRVRGLRKFRVAEIASFLPILLQIALVLLFIGLMLFARSTHGSIATVISIFVAIWLFFLVTTTFLPIISPSCPYKTPLLKAISLRFRHFLARRWDWALGSYPCSASLDPLFVEESTSQMDTEMKTNVLMDAYETFQDIKSWDIIMRCVDLNSPLESLRMLTTLVTQKYGSEITSNSDLRGLFDHAQLRLLLRSMVGCLRRASFDALKGGESAWFTSTESSSGSDAALDSVVRCWTRHEHVFSVPHHPGFIAPYILSQVGLSQRDLPEEINNDDMGIIIRCATKALDSGSGTHAGFKCTSSLSHLLEMCRISFLCAGNATGDTLNSWKNDFVQVTVRLAGSLKAMSYPEENVSTKDVFQAQFTLDMAMRLHMKVPGIIDKSLFQALHVCSVKMFNLEVKDRPSEMGSHIRTRNNALSDDDAPGNVLEADWEQVLRERKYVGVRIPDDGMNRNEWYYEDLQASCKQRIGFMWSRLHLPTTFRVVLEEFEVESSI